MERKTTLFERISAMIVALAMLFSMMPVQVFADNADTASAPAQTAQAEPAPQAAPAPAAASQPAVQAASDASTSDPAPSEPTPVPQFAVGIDGEATQNWNRDKNATYTLNANVTVDYDADPDKTTYNWEVSGSDNGSDVAIQGSDDAKEVTLTTDKKYLIDPVTVTLTVTQSKGNSATASVTVNVQGTPEITVKVTPKSPVYGDDLTAAVFEGDTDITASCTFAWESPDNNIVGKDEVLSQPAAGTYALQAYYPASENGNRKATGLNMPNIQVSTAPADVTSAVTNTPEGGFVYGGAAPEIVFTSSVAGTVNYNSTDVVLNATTEDGKTVYKSDPVTVADTTAGKHPIDYTFTAKDAANYDVKTDSGKTYTIAQKSVKAVAFTLENTSKTYDGKTDAGAVTAVTLDGVLDGDDVTANVEEFEAVADTADTTATKATLHVLDIEMALDGTAAANYTLDKPDAVEVPFTVTPREVKLTGAKFDDKTYDGGTNVNAPLSLTWENLVDGDEITLNGADFTTGTLDANGAFTADSSVKATAVAIDLTNATLGGTAAANYMLVKETAYGTVKVTQKEISYTVEDGFTVKKTSDGTLALTGENQDAIQSNVKLVDVVAGDENDVALVFDFTNAKYASAAFFGENSVSGIILGLDGAKAENYTLSDDKLTLNAAVGTKAANDVDLTTSAADPAEIAAGLTVNFSERVNKSGAGEYWYNNGVPTTADVTLLDKNGNLYKKDPVSGVNEWTDVYARQGEGNSAVYYGPFTLTYLYDDTAPNVSKVEVTAGHKNQDIDKALELNEDGSIRAWDKGSVTVTVTAKDAPDGKNSGVYKVYLYKSTEPQDETALNVLADTAYTENTLTLGEGDVNQSYYVYVKLIDNAGNVSYRMLNGRVLLDDQKPTVKSAGLTIAEDKKSATFSYEVSDGDDAAKAAGLYSSKVYLYDGVNDTLALYATLEETTNELKDTMLPDSANAPLTYSNTVSFGNMGSQLSILVEVQDWAGNTLYFDQNGTAYDSVEAFKDSRAVDDNTTFVIEGTPKVTYSYDNNTCNVYSNVSYFSTDRTVTIAAADFTDIPVSQLTVKIDGAPENLDGTYSVDKHAYLYETYTHTYNEENTAENPHTFAIEGTGCTNFAADPAEGTAAPNSFVLDKTNPVLTVVYNDNDEPAGTHARGGETVNYFNADRTAIITVTDANLPESGDVNQYFNIELAKGSVQTTQTAWTEIEGGYQAVVTFTEDTTDPNALAGNSDFSSIKVTVNDLTMAHEQNNESKFVLDKTAPTFNVAYSAATNDEFAPEYYYGLTNGKDDPTNVVATITLKESNFFAEDATEAITVTKDGKTYTDYTVEWTNANPAVGEITINAKENGGNDGRFVVSFAYSDPAANKMTAAEDAAVTVADGVYDGTEHVSVIDTLRPQVVVDVAGAFNHYKDDGDYFKDSFTTTFTLTDSNAWDDYITATVKKDGGEDTAIAGSSDVYTYTADKNTADAEGHYSFAFSGTDKAKNLVQIALGMGATENDVLSDDASAFTSGVKVLDTTSPTVNITYTELAPTHFYVENADDAFATAYYSSDLTADFAFNDKETLDENKLHYIRTREGEQFASGSFDTNTDNAAPVFSHKVEAVTSHDNDGVYRYTIWGEDKAGNALVVTEQAYGKNAKGELTANNGPVEGNGTKDNAYATAPKAIDTVAPTAKITYTALDGTHFYKEGDTQVNAYYNHDFQADFVFADAYGDGSKSFALDTAKMHYTQAITDPQDNLLGSEINTAQKSASYTVTGSADNAHYYFTAYGEDKAGNALIVTESDTTAPGKEAKYENVSANYTGSYHKVLDTVAPVFTLTVNDPANDLNIAVDEQNRAFYNGDIKADFVVTDTNLDSGKIKTNTASRTGTDFNYDAEDVAWAGIDLTKNDPGSQETTVSLSEEGKTDGIYRFEIEGEDRAGNRLVQSGDEAAETDFRATNKVGEGQFWTNIKVRDTLAPVLDIELTDGSVFYKARLGEATQQNNIYYNLQENRPYRQSGNASGTLTKTDCSPASVEYVIDSTTAAQTEPGSAYSHDAIGLSMNGEQVFSIAKLVIKDRAGNISTMPKPGNKIYLDVTAPTEDELAPTVSVVAQESGEGRSVAGRDLFNSDVTVRANVTDPGEGVRSSGLYQVYYEVLVNDADWTDKVSVSGKGSVKASGIIGYGTSGKEYASTDAVDETIISRDTIDFGFDANTFNYNDVKIFVWAEDNSGNLLAKSEAAHYFFGIDITTPTIEVRYDNNSAQNEKYFKEDRTATITITERNFDPSQTVITTESKAISSWTYQAGAMPNGDDDKWIATVGYTQDGDYTFDVTTVDLVGHKADAADYGDSVAPREFTIDKTSPIISIHFDNDDVRNGKYYNAARTATVSIEEHNFSTDGVTLTTTADIQEGAVAAPGAGSWSSGGDMNTATVPFTEDGNYTMHVEYVDLAGNEAEPQDVDEFVVDTTAPELTFSINDEAFDEATYTPHAYNGEVVPSITYHDINYDMSGTQMSIVGAKNVDSQILSGAPAEDAMGGVYACENIAETPENDDVYTCTGKVVDMAGNESTVDFVFSVNRYGSNYLLSDATQQLVDNYYTNKAPELGITEINVNTLKSKEITYALNGDIKTLEQNQDYSVQESGTETSWKQYDYDVFSSNFTQEGVYDITIYSEDEAGNSNSNHTERVKEYSKNISFVLDQTAPSITISGVEEDGRYDTDTRLISVGYSENFAIDTITITNGDKTDSYTADQLNATSGTLEFQIPASNNKQVVTVTAADKAGNTVTVESPRFLLTSNKLIQFVNNTPLLVGTIVLVVLIVLAIIDYLRKGFLFVLLHRKKSESKN